MSIFGLLGYLLSFYLKIEQENVNLFSGLVLMKSNDHANEGHSYQLFPIGLLNNNLHGLSPPVGLVSPLGGFASLSFDRRSLKLSVQCHLADRNAICILHLSDCACLFSQFDSFDIKSL